MPFTQPRYEERQGIILCRYIMIFLIFEILIAVCMILSIITKPINWIAFIGFAISLFVFVKLYDMHKDIKILKEINKDKYEEIKRKNENNDIAR